MAPSRDVVVIGAGPAGLLAAWHAARAGHQVTVVERAPVVGGMAASFEVAGIRVDHGSHRLHPSTSPAVLAELRSLLGDDLQVRPRHGRMRVEGRWVGFPLRTLDLARRLPISFTAHAAVDALGAPWRTPRRDTFDEVIRAGLGPTIADDFYLPYVAKIWGADPSELSGDLARRRVSARSPADLARRLLKGARAEGRTFLYPRTGFGQISEVLADAAVAAGAELRTAVDVTRLVPGADSVTVELADATIEAGQVWSTAPVASLVPLISPAAPAPVTAALGRLTHRALALVYLVVDRRQYSEYDAHYLPAVDVLMSRLSEPQNYRTDPGARQDHTVLCAEVPCSVGDATWNASDADLGARVREAVVRSGLPPVAVGPVVVRRLPKVYPALTPGYETDLDAVEAWVGSQSRIVGFGRQALFAPDNTHHVLAMGAAAADCLGPDGQFDEVAWAAHRAAFRANVVED